MLIVVLVGTFRSVFPAYSSVYGENQTAFQSKEGDWYLANYDSYFWYNDAQGYAEGKNITADRPLLTHLAHTTRYYFGDSALMYLPVIFSVIGCLFFFGIARFYMSDLYTFLATLFFATSPYNFMFTFKGFLDTPSLVSALLLAYLYMFLKMVTYPTKDFTNPYFWLSLAVASLLSGTWSGAILLYLILFASYLIGSAISKVYTKMSIFGLVVLGALVLLTGANFLGYAEPRFQTVGELQHFVPSPGFETIAFVFLILLAGAEIGSAIAKRGMSVAMTLTLLPMIAFTVLSLIYIRFAYLAIIFVALYVFTKLDNSVFPSQVKKALAAFLILAYLVTFNYNVPGIFMEDAIYDSLTQLPGDDLPILSFWDNGHLYQAYTDHPVIFAGTVQGIEEFGRAYLTTNQTESAQILDAFADEYYLILSTKDLHFYLFEESTGYTMQPGSTFNILLEKRDTPHFEFISYHQGVNQDIYVYRRNTDG